MPPEPFFTGAGLNRADALRAAPERIAELAGRADARELVWRQGIPAIDREGRLEWQEVGASALFLGLEGDAPRFSALAEPAQQVFSVMPLLAQLDGADAPLFAAAMSLARWHVRHRFCANCGHDSEIVRGGWSRRCPNCSVEHFPRVDPVVIMLVEHDRRLLLGRQPHYPAERYSALAGFVEVGESIEDSVRREVKEEAGIDVADVSYVASQPWLRLSQFHVPPFFDKASEKAKPFPWPIGSPITSHKLGPSWLAPPLSALWQAMHLLKTCWPFAGSALAR